MGKRTRIEIIPLGEIEFSVLGHLKENLSTIFDGEITIAQPQPVPAHALNPNRAQYSASIILDFLEKFKKEKMKQTLAIVDKDLYVQGLNFVFGMADSFRNVCVISLTRLR